MYPLIKSVHFLSLYILLGGPAFWYLMWKPVMHDPMGTKSRSHQRLLGAGLLLGTLFLIGSSVADALRAASQVVDIRDWDMLRLFFGASQYGRLTIAKGALALLAGVLFWVAQKLDRGGGGQGHRKSHESSRRQTWMFKLLSVSLPLAGTMASLGLLWTVSLASHAASKPGLVPLVSDVIHLLSSVVWAGGVLYFGLLPWRDLERARLSVAKSLAALVGRFSNMALLAVALVIVTGVFASSLHIATTMAISETSYGRTFGLKIALFIVVMLVAGVNLVVIGPSLRRVKEASDRARFQNSVRRLGRSVRVEAVVIVGLLVMASVLTTLPPPDTLGHVSERVWKRTIGDYRAKIRMVPVDMTGQAEIDIHLVDGLDQPAPGDVRVFVHLEMPTHPMGTRELQAEPVFPGLYRATPLISMVGHWQAEVKVRFPDRTFATAVFDFEATHDASSLGRP